jgi:dipeptidyl-peptidase-4
VQSRDQHTVRFLAVDPATGATTVLYEQRDPCWVQLVPGLPARTHAGKVLTHVDRGDTRHLAVDGAMVTPPGLQVRSVLSVDGEQVLFAASDEPTDTHLCSYHPQTGVRRLTTDPGVHSGMHRAGTVVHIAHRADQPSPEVTVRREDEPPVSITSMVERPVLTIRAQRLVLGPRALRADLYLPSWHRRDDPPLPILLDPYGGASKQRVTAAADWRCLVAQWFAEQGFAVLVADGAGTPGRGPTWEREVHGDLFGPALDDQITALHEAAAHNRQLDPQRVAIRGWSFSGALAALAVLRHPDIFHAAVAGAGVTDQRLYNTHWRERFLGHPTDFGERYDAASLIRQAPALTRPLLLIHGLADDNVHPANTLRLSRALQAADRPHELLLLPHIGHNPIGQPGTDTLLQYQVTFLHRHLQRPLP